MEGSEGQARLTLLAILAIAAVVVGSVVLIRLWQKRTGEDQA